MINKRWITLPVVYSRPFASKAVFWAILNELQFAVDCCLSIMKNSQRRTEVHSKSLKKPLLRQKDDYTPQVR